MFVGFAGDPHKKGETRVTIRMRRACSMQYHVSMDDEDAPTSPVMVRMSPRFKKKLDARAKLEKRSRADIMRLLMEYGLDRMPQGWVR